MARTFGPSPCARFQKSWFAKRWARSGGRTWAIDNIMAGLPFRLHQTMPPVVGQDSRGPGYAVSANPDACVVNSLR